jgi:hypothetical protein
MFFRTQCSAAQFRTSCSVLVEFCSVGEGTSTLAVAGAGPFWVGSLGWLLIASCFTSAACCDPLFWRGLRGNHASPCQCEYRQQFQHIWSAWLKRSGKTGRANWASRKKGDESGLGSSPTLYCFIFYGAPVVQDNSLRLALPLQTSCRCLSACQLHRTQGQVSGPQKRGRVPPMDDPSPTSCCMYVWLPPQWLSGLALRFNFFCCCLSATPIHRSALSSRPPESCLAIWSFKCSAILGEGHRDRIPNLPISLVL